MDLGVEIDLHPDPGYARLTLRVPVGGCEGPTSPPRRRHDPRGRKVADRPAIVNQAALSKVLADGHRPAKDLPRAASTLRPYESMGPIVAPPQQTQRVGCVRSVSPGVPAEPGGDMARVALQPIAVWAGGDVDGTGEPIPIVHVAAFHLMDRGWRGRPDGFRR